LLTINTLEMRLFAKPIAIAAISPLVYAALAYWVPHQLGASQIFKSLVGMAQEYAGIASLTILACALLVFLYRIYEFWQWENGYTPCCPRCGMMMRERSGRYGWFWGCIRYPSCRGTLDY
jgi:hypothetical protein